MSYPQYGGPLTHPNGTTILVLGILSLVVCSFLGPFAWSMGTKAMREIDESGYVYENRGMVQAGRICGIIATIIMIVVSVLVVAGLLLGGLATYSNT